MVITNLKDQNNVILKYRSLKPQNSVLVFDSGIGGLLVYDRIRKLFPNLHYIYAFDNVAFPYGEKNKEFILQRVIQILTAIQKYYCLELVVIACNTVSTISLSFIRKKFRFPVIGVVPAIKTASCLTINKIVGVLATPGTITHQYTHRLVKRFSNRYQITLLGSSKMVKLSEEKVLYGKNISLKLLRQILQPWLHMNKPPDTVVLGCTHFTVLTNELLTVLPIGTRIVDSSETIPYRISCLIKKENQKLKSIGENTAICMEFTKKTKQFLPILYNYGFSRLRQISL